MNESVLPIAVLKINDGYHLFATIKIEGKNARMLIDTAASRTVFDEKRVLKMIKEPEITNNFVNGSTAGGSVEQRQTTIKSLDFGSGAIIEDYAAVLMDLKHINNTYKQNKMHPIDGIIGADILVTYEAMIDLSTKELII